METADSRREGLYSRPRRPGRLHRRQRQFHIDRRSRRRCEGRLRRHDRHQSAGRLLLPGHDDGPQRQGGRRQYGDGRHGNGRSAGRQRRQPGRLSAARAELDPDADQHDPADHDHRAPDDGGQRSDRAAAFRGSAGGAAQQPRGRQRQCGRQCAGRRQHGAGFDRAGHAAARRVAAHVRHHDPGAERRGLQPARAADPAERLRSRAGSEDLHSLLRPYDGQARHRRHRHGFRRRPHRHHRPGRRRDGARLARHDSSREQWKGQDGRSLPIERS